MHLPSITHSIILQNEHNFIQTEGINRKERMRLFLWSEYRKATVTVRFWKGTEFIFFRAKWLVIHTQSQLRNHNKTKRNKCMNKENFKKNILFKRNRRQKQLYSQILLKNHLFTHEFCIRTYLHIDLTVVDQFRTKDMFAIYVFHVVQM